MAELRESRLPDLPFTFSADKNISLAVNISHRKKVVNWQFPGDSESFEN
ncbi:MAG TPA: hypothetical protein VJN43_01500 [Bryobacteraceae bacterium]|nr:hypothetical protein [Bryobacteraceae bacterium]